MHVSWGPLWLAVRSTGNRGALCTRFCSGASFQYMPAETEDSILLEKLKSFVRIDENFVVNEACNSHVGEMALYVQDSVPACSKGVKRVFRGFTLEFLLVEDTFKSFKSETEAIF